MWRLFAFVVGFIVLLAVLFSLIFGGHKTPKPSELTDPSFSDTTLIYTMEGPIVARENHNSVRIKVSYNSRQMSILNGYEYRVVNSKHYENDQASYDAIRQALRTSGFLRQNHNSTATSIYSVCPLGDRYTYQVIDATGQEIYHTWSTSCGDTNVSTFGGNSLLVRQLFIDQIPDYPELTADLTL